MQENKTRILDPTASSSPSGSELSLSARILSASLGSLLTCMVVTPLDVVKVRMQSQPTIFLNAAKNATTPICCCCCHSTATSSSSTSSSSLLKLTENHQCRGVLTRNKLHITGTLDGLTKILQHEGIFGLWKGLYPTLVMTIPTTAVYFACYDGIKYRLKNSPYMTGTMSHFIPIMSGSFSRIFASAVASPFEIMRTQMQATQSGSGSKSFVQMTKELLRSPSRVWTTGLGPTLMRDVPFSAIYWTIIEMFKESPAIQSSSLNANPFLMSFTSGALAGLVASVATTPFDVIKTKVQVEMSESHKRDQGMLRIGRRIVRESGFRGLYQGVVPRVLRVMPSCAIMLGTYDLAKDIVLRHGQ
eukprot:TRINITY_DN4953_c0_g1_i1.p1 TRINITY_DN4953_c0_g1~~TRINITY_DN4953_c0_g1_i1.p1  ORF type:complete len:387 (-),score=73.98 TRINITY_DN4953_c0_g1_i1:45-1121(-)